MANFQWVFDNASELSIENLRVIGSTTARDCTTKAVSRGTVPKRFIIKLPDGPYYSDIRTDIAGIEALDRDSTETIDIKYSQFPWYYGYTAPGSDEQYTVICIGFPQWTVFDTGLVRWSGAFEFVEVL